MIVIVFLGKNSRKSMAKSRILVEGDGFDGRYAQVFPEIEFTVACVNLNARTQKH